MFSTKGLVSSPFASGEKVLGYFLMINIEKWHLLIDLVFFSGKTWYTVLTVF